MSAIVITSATVVAVLAELWLRPSAALLLTPLLVSALALVFAHRIYRRDRENQRVHQDELERSSAIHMATVEALALAIDARDRSSRSSLQREQRHATALARSFGLPAEEVECIRTAALLHDVGKLAVPEHILMKPGPLTEDERSKMRTHSSVGAAIVEQVPFPQPVATLVRGHHERWDGRGYPAGLRGADIPLGARILAVVDYFAAITSDRPFSRAMPDAEAVNVLWQEAGNALDPAVVSRYVHLLPSLQDAEEEARLADARDDVAARYREGEALLVGRPSRPTPSALLDDIGVASQELGALYAMAEAMGSSLGVSDTMAALTSKLDRLVPFSTLALYLHDPTNSVSRCRFASGPGHKAFPGLLVRDGEGLVGTAIATRECIVNGDPAVDLDNLKPINDTFGHQAGNRALCGVAAVLRGAIRPYDICVRYGGDEFIVLLSDFGSDQAAAKSLELQNAVESMPFSVGDLLRVRLTISVGAAVFPADGDSYEALLQVADARMYEDKAARKHRLAERAMHRTAHEHSDDPSLRRS